MSIISNYESMLLDDPCVVPEYDGGYEPSFPEICDSMVKGLVALGFSVEDATWLVFDADWIEGAWRLAERLADGFGNADDIRKAKAIIEQNK